MRILPCLLLASSVLAADAQAADKSQAVAALEDKFDDGSLRPFWKITSHDGLTVRESDGVVKIHGSVPRSQGRYVNANFELAERIPVKSFEARIDVLAVSGTFERAQHRSRTFGFFAKGSNGHMVGLQFWANQYRIQYDNGHGGKRMYAPPNGDEKKKAKQALLDKFKDTPRQEMLDALSGNSDPSNYFHTDAPGTEMISIDQLDNNIRERPEGVANALPLMFATATGQNPGGGKRKPISVSKQPNGRYRVEDGNSTFAIAKQAGWKHLPALQVK